MDGTAVVCGCPCGVLMATVAAVTSDWHAIPRGAGRAAFAALRCRLTFGKSARSKLQSMLHAGEQPLAIVRIRRKSEQTCPQNRRSEATPRGAAGALSGHVVHG